MSPGYFTDDSVLRQVHRESALAHPLAVSVCTGGGGTIRIVATLRLGAAVGETLR